MYRRCYPGDDADRQAVSFALCYLQEDGECIMPKEGVFAVVIRGGQIHTGDEVKLIPANIYASIKDRPADSRCELLTVIEGAHAGEKALYIDGRIRVASGSACR